MRVGDLQHVKVIIPEDIDAQEPTRIDFHLERKQWTSHLVSISKAQTADNN
jgi:hypothetical protein